MNNFTDHTCASESHEHHPDGVGAKVRAAMHSTGRAPGPVSRKPPDLQEQCSEQSQLLPQLNAVYLGTRTRLIQEMTHIMDAAMDWHGVAIQPNRDGLQFIARDFAFGYLRWAGRLDVCISAELGERLISEGMAARDSNLAGSGRVVWIVRSSADVDRAVWLLRISYLRCSRNLGVPPVIHTAHIGESHEPRI